MTISEHEVSIFMMCFASFGLGACANLFGMYFAMKHSNKRLDKLSEDYKHRVDAIVAIHQQRFNDAADIIDQRTLQ